MTASTRMAKQLIAVLGSGALISGIVVGGVLVGCAPVVIEANPAATSTAQVSEDSTRGSLPSDFTYVSEAAPSIVTESRYATPNNFTGSVVDGYVSANVAILRVEAAQALAAVQDELAVDGLGLLVWDAFRPTRAVDYFWDWSKNTDVSTKSEYYPDYAKPDLFDLGYIAKESRHSLGGTVDLTIIDAVTLVPIDMGGPFDYFGELSHYDTSGLTGEQSANRELLRSVMIAHGFEPYPLEWWHFSFPLADDALPANFIVE